MKQFFTPRTIALILCGLLIVVVGILVAIAMINGNIGNQMQTQAGTVVVIKVANDQLPNGFPTNVNVNSNPSSTVDNFDALAPNGQTQGTRSFTSANSVSVEYANYLQFLSNPANGWKLKLQNDGSASNPPQAMLFATNATAQLTIEMHALPADPSNPNAKTLVQVTYTTNPPVTGK